VIFVQLRRARQGAIVHLRSGSFIAVKTKNYPCEFWTLERAECLEIPTSTGQIPEVG